MPSRRAGAAAGQGTERPRAARRLGVSAVAGRRRPQEGGHGVAGGGSASPARAAKPPRERRNGAAGSPGTPETGDAGKQFTGRRAAGGARRERAGGRGRRAGPRPPRRRPGTPAPPRRGAEVCAGGFLRRGSGGRGHSRGDGPRPRPAPVDLRHAQGDSAAPARRGHRLRPGTERAGGPGGAAPARVRGHRVGTWSGRVRQALETAHALCPAPACRRGGDQFPRAAGAHDGAGARSGEAHPGHRQRRRSGAVLAASRRRPPAGARGPAANTGAGADTRGEEPLWIAGSGGRRPPGTAGAAPDDRLVRGPAVRGGRTRSPLGAPLPPEFRGVPPPPAAGHRRAGPAGPVPPASGRGGRDAAVPGGGTPSVCRRSAKGPPTSSARPWPAAFRCWSAGSATTRAWCGRGATGCCSTRSCRGTSPMLSCASPTRRPRTGAAWEGKAAGSRRRRCRRTCSWTATWNCWIGCRRKRVAKWRS